MNKPTGFRVGAMVLSYLVTLFFIIGTVGNIGMAQYTGVNIGVLIFLNVLLLTIDVLISVPNKVSVLIGSILDGIFLIILLISIISLISVMGMISHYMSSEVTLIMVLLIVVFLITLLSFIFSLIAAVRLFKLDAMNRTQFQSYGQPYGQQYQQGYQPYGQQYQQQQFQQNYQPQYQQYEQPVNNASGTYEPQASADQQPSDEQSTVCPACGAQIRADAKFCTKCGTKLV